MELRDKEERLADYRDFIMSYMPKFNCDLYSCTYVQCCNTFGHDGPRILPYEKAEIVEAIRSQGLEDIADYVIRNNSIPATDDEPVTRKCQLLDNNGCLLHDTKKPSVCVDYPIFISESEESVRIDIDTYCSLIVIRGLSDSKPDIQQEFEARFGKKIELKLGHSLEEKMHIYYDDEL
jgi:hypothetical protein